MLQSHDLLVSITYVSGSVIVCLALFFLIGYIVKHSKKSTSVKILTVLVSVLVVLATVISAVQGQ